jgi:predicted esterase
VIFWLNLRVAGVARDRVFHIYTMTRVPVSRSRDLSRREFCAASLRASAGLALGGCGSLLNARDNSARVHLTSRPLTPSASVSPGVYTLVTNGGRDAILSVPASYVPTKPLPLVLALHGATLTAEGPINLLSGLSESAGFAILAPQSRGTTWDAIHGFYGPDVAVIDRSLKYAFDHLAIAPQRVFISGFSDGASYALGFGLSNGDLFSRVIAFSPGFVTESDPRGKPPIFISHGTQDTILPIYQASRVIVPRLRDSGYTVEYREFTGGHGVPAGIAQAAVDWFMAE